MDKVERYEFFQDDTNYTICGMTHQNDGRFVLYADFALLASENERLKQYIRGDGNTLIDEMNQTIADLRAELALCETTHANLNDEYHVLKRRLEEAERERNELREQMITGWYEEKVPIYRQGVPKHELEEVVTAEEVTGLVNMITRFRDGFDPVITLLKDGFDLGSMLVREKIREALKAVEGATTVAISRAPDQQDS